MDDLLKEAIADAKAVRETALENAKIALEEAFTPRLQSMLARKIQSELDVAEQEGEDEDEDEDEFSDEPSDEVPADDMGDVEGMSYEDDEDPTDDYSEEEPEMDMGDDEEVPGEDDEMDMEGVIEINGVKYAPVVSEDDEEEDEEDMGRETEDVDDLDLEAILRELETDEDVEEAHEPGHDEDDDEPTTETIDEDDDEDDEDDDKKDTVGEEVDQSSGIGSSDNKNGTTDKSSAIGSKGKAKHESVEITEGDDEFEDIDLEEVIKALSEEEDEEEATNKVAKLQSDLDEHRNVVKYLRSKLNEVNLLNAKLLFTNKLFRSFGLSNDQKMKVVENFDRAHNLREVKLVYSTLAESFGTKKTKTEIKEHKGSASKAVASTKSGKQEVIADGSEMRDRFKKLAGII
jgi:hypothetical protein